MRIPRHARMQRNLNGVTFTFQEMKEENFASVTSIARVLSTTAIFLNCRTIIFMPRFVWLLNARAPHRIKFTAHNSVCFLWLNQQAGKTNLKNTNIGDIKHKWEYFQSLELFLDQEPLKTDLMNLRWIFQTEFVGCWVFWKRICSPGKGRERGERACRQTFETAIPPSCNYPTDHLSARSLSVS